MKVVSAHKKNSQCLDTNLFQQSAPINVTFSFLKCIQYLSSVSKFLCKVYF